MGQRLWASSTSRCNGVSAGRLLQYPDIPHGEPDLDAFLSIKPGIPFAQELEQALVLVGQIENHESLAWDVEHESPRSSGTPSVPWGSGYACLLVRKVAACSLRAVRIRYSRAAYTSKQTVITISSAMMRSGFLR